ncbi:hypothetical protein BC629DRAFT_923425 [Irpex lacteus]|nr:hypothetical protein BC629DRAFT_923425 [Irpex lacteus]
MPNHLSFVCSPPLRPQTTYHTFAHSDYTSAADRGLGLLIPQQVYQPRASYSPLSPIHFSCGGVPGVRLVDAEPGVIRSLDNRTVVPTLNPRGNRMTLRIFWPGYDDWAFENITIKHHTPQGNGYNMEELAGTVAVHIRKFYQDRGYSSCSAPGWEIHMFPFETLYLLELRHVGQSSWQPVLVCRS